jgi:hypothetical protein
MCGANFPDDRNRCVVLKKQLTSNSQSIREKSSKMFNNVKGYILIKFKIKSYIQKYCQNLPNNGCRVETKKKLDQLYFKKPLIVSREILNCKLDKIKKMLFVQQSL